MTAHNWTSSFAHAVRGVRTLYRRERNFKIEIWWAVAVAVLLVVCRIAAPEAAAVLIVSALVLVLEAVNSAVEHAVDLLKPRLDAYVGEIKDMLAAAVLIAAAAAVAVGLIVFIPPVAAALRAWL